MENLKNRFVEMRGLDSFQRVEPTHPFPLYIGLDNMGRCSLFCITTTMPTQLLTPSKMISVFVGRRYDQTCGMTFSLDEPAFLDQFVCFCNDMIEASKDLRDSDKSADFLSARYIQWQKLFEKSSDGLLSPAEIKGLLGEMYYLHTVLIPQYGEAAAVNSWCGPERSDRDFECDDTWYEVKTTVSGAAAVRISSVEQLDTVQTGHLIVISMDKTSESDSKKLTLNIMYHLLKNNLSSDVLREKLDTVLLSLGYYENTAYDKFCFQYNGMISYQVNDAFPCLRRKDLPLAVQDVKYALSLAAIADYEEK